MKTISSKIKVMFVLAVCAGFIVPAAVSAAENIVELVLVDGVKYESGDYTIPENFLMSSQSVIRKNHRKSFQNVVRKHHVKSLQNIDGEGNINRLEFEVINGYRGKNRLSSARIELLDNNGNPIAVAITPDQLNQNVSVARGTISKDDLAGLTDIILNLKLRGPRNGFITLSVTEFYEEDEPVVEEPVEEPCTGFWCM